MESRDDVKKIRIGAMEQLGAIPKVLKELQELVPLLSVAYSTDGRTSGYEAPLSISIPVATGPDPGGGYRTAHRATRQRTARCGDGTSTVGRWNGRTGASDDGRCSKGDRPPGRGYRGRIGGDGQQGARGDKYGTYGQCLRFGGSPCPLPGAGSSRMKDDADKVRCHPHRRGGSGHQLREGSSLAQSVRPRC